MRLSPGKPGRCVWPDGSAVAVAAAEALSFQDVPIWIYLSNYLENIFVAARRSPVMVYLSGGKMTGRET